MLPRTVSALVWAALLGLATPAAAQDKVLGLLALPEVFGNGPCHSFEPEVINLYSAPGDGAPIATIQVDQHWSFAPHGGCDGLKVSVHRGGVRSELPTREFSNEAPAAVVLAVKDGWFKIRLTSGVAWLRGSRRDRFMSMADLFSEYTSLTTLTEAHSGALLDAPGGKPAEIKPAPPASTPVRVLGRRELGGQEWLQVAVMSHSVCDAERGPPEVVTIGWLRAHAPSGEPTVWFFSRGC